MDKRKLFVVSFSNGEKWGIPAEIIAKNKACHYSPNNASERCNEYNAMMEWFDANDYEFADWAFNNMDWDHVREHAVRMEYGTEFNYDEAWCNAEWECVVLE